MWLTQMHCVLLRACAEYLSTPNDGNRFSLDDDTCKILSPDLGRITRGEVE